MVVIIIWNFMYIFCFSLFFLDASIKYSLSIQCMLKPITVLLAAVRSLFHISSVPDKVYLSRIIFLISCVPKNTYLNIYSGRVKPLYWILGKS